MTDASYSQLKVNSINRLRKRGTYDYKTIHGIVNECPVVHVSFSPDASEPFPTILPMIGQMASFHDQSGDLNKPMDCYLHGYVSSRVMRLSHEAMAQDGGLPVCIAATKVDGYVLALSPFHNSYNYRSAVLHGYAQPVEDEAEKLWALQLITNSVVPTRWENSRETPTKTELTSTKILRVKIFAGSGKVRTGGPSDDRGDMKDETLRDRTWVGVVPTWEVIGEPLPAAYNGHEKVPAYLGAFIQEANDRSKKVALAAAEHAK